jgi:hypothetical protein
MQCPNCAFVKAETVNRCGCEQEQNLIIICRGGFYGGCPTPREEVKYSCHYQDPVSGWPEVAAGDFCGKFQLVGGD